MKIAVIGGGAAGFFAAIAASDKNASHEVTLYERSNKLLTKVLVSGGGRCNVTHACFDNVQLATHYPRGEKQLKGAFSRFTTTDTIKWFGQRNVQLKTEADGRMFPVTNTSETIADCLLEEAERNGVKICRKTDIRKIEPSPQGGFVLHTSDAQKIAADKVIVTTGGNAKAESFHWLEQLGHAIETPVPSLFTFNIPRNPLTELMGTSVDPAKVKIVETKQEFSGPVLITHWGLSGPAVLKLSSFAARDLARLNYHFTVQVNWLHNLKEEQVRETFLQLKQDFPTKHFRNVFPYHSLTKRLQDYLFQRAEIMADKNTADVSKAELNRLVAVLLYDQYEVKGKTTFKEEFVTCGGVSLKDVDFKTMESKKVKGLFFAGEVLDIDGITGGFNFQAAWTTGFIAGHAAAEKDPAMLS